MFFWFFTFITTNIITYYRRPNPFEDILQIVDLSKYKKICDIFPLINFLLIEEYQSYFYYHAILMLLRFICFHSTILPPPMPLKVRFSFGVIPNFDYDLMFSGHTMTCVLCLFFAQNAFCYYIILINSILCSIMLILTKEHYTIDIIVAWMAVYNIYYIFNI